KDVRWVHQRTETGKRSRSLKILRDWALTHDDAWVHINLGIELHAAHEYAEAITHFAQHVEKSEWAEERALSCLRAADCAVAIDLVGKGGYSEAQSWVRRARSITPKAFEPLYAEAKLAYMRASMLGDERGLRESIEFAHQALATEQVLATRPESPPHVFAQKKYRARMLLEGSNGRNPGSVPVFDVVNAIPAGRFEFDMKPYL